MEEQKLLKKKRKATGNNSALLSVCTDLAAYYNAKGKYSKAIKEYELMSEIYNKQGQILLYGQTNRGIGEAYMAQQQFDSAIKYFNIYLDSAVKEHDVLEQQRALAQLGHLYLTWHLEYEGEKSEEIINNAYKYFIKSMQKCEILPNNTEKQDMMARLFSNLGLVKEAQKNFTNALELYKKSLRICLEHDLYEQLYRDYISIAALFDKQAKHQEAIKNFNLAIETAKKLSNNRVELVCGALLGKSEILIKLADFSGAKQVLRKAYKFKTPNERDRKTIERNLRVVAGMCKFEDNLVTAENDKEKKKIYEKMGDGACDLKNFSKAIDYYKKMLEIAQVIGVSDKELGECYYCIGQTYKDLGNYKEAVNYLEKEYQLCSENLKGGLNTLCLITDIMETASDNVDSIKKVYDRALDDCKKKSNVKEEKRIILRYIDFLRRSFCHKDAFKLEQQLKSLNSNENEESSSSISDPESDHDDSNVHIGQDITLSDITDLSEQSDSEIPYQSTTKLRKKNTVKFRKNLNGEWPLHTACIKGNLQMVKHWLGVKHPINVRDNAGWMPLHEAAIHGHVEIVELLLDNKAAINDRGGSECNGVTPLHDACSNGHLDIVQLLLDRGASAFVKTDDGSTPLEYLKYWHQTTDKNLSDSEKQQYEYLVKRLTEASDKTIENSKDLKDIVMDQSFEQDEGPKECSNIGLLRRGVEMDMDFNDVDFEDEEITNTPKRSPLSLNYTTEHNATNEYQSVMDILRNKSCPSRQENRTLPVALRKSALIDEENFVDMDDWLENDIPTGKNKKRRTAYSNELFSRNNSCGTTSGFVDVAPRRISDPQEKTSLVTDWLDTKTTHSSSPYKRRSSGDSCDSFNSSRSKRRLQSTLLDSGFSCSKSKMPSLSSRLGNQSQLRASRDSLMDIDVDPVSQKVGALSSYQSASQQHSNDPTLFVDVEIERKVFRVPVLLSQIHVKSIKWLADEAAQRYASKEYMKPTLELETSSGAVLADNDLITLLFPMGGMQAEKVVGKVIEWSLPPLIDRYKETCAHMNIEEDLELCNLIQSLSTNLNLLNRGALADQLCPLFKAINHQSALTELNVSGNFLNSTSFSILCNSLTTLSNIKKLNISCTGLQAADFSLLANTIQKHNAVFGNLSHLDISDNFGISKNCLQDLSIITNTVNLTYLNISNIGLENIANISQNTNSLCLTFLEYLNVSNNKLQPADLKKILSWTNGNVLKELNVSNNTTSKGCLKQIMEAFDGRKNIVLETISLARCSVTDSELFEFLLLAPNTTSFYLPYNPDLTSVSLRRLMERENVCRLELFGCTNIWKYFSIEENDTKSWSVSFNREIKMVVFNISDGNRYMYEILINIFKRKYPNCEVELMDDDFLRIILRNEK